MTSKPINVSSVPQLSPFRYPGGKTWLVPHIRQWLRHCKPSVLVEPFCGGGITGLTAGFERLAKHVILIEKDENVAAVWKTIFSRNAKWLAQQILEFDISPERVAEVVGTPITSVRSQAFLTIVRNRTCHGGIMYHGSGVIKTGENGKGIASRWYPQTLARRILAIHERRERFTFIEGDGFDEIEKWMNDPSVAIFVDPPYTVSRKGAGKRLYLYNEIDHEKLFSLMNSLRGNFLMTYDDDEAVAELADGFNFATELVPMKSRQHVTKNEALISSNHEWMRDRQLQLF
ncbi:MAG: DNA adenine methylase [Gimesia sp.]